MSDETKITDETATEEAGAPAPDAETAASDSPETPAPVPEAGEDKPKRRRKSGADDTENEKAPLPEPAPWHPEPSVITEAKQLALGHHSFAIRTDKNGHGRILIQAPEKSIEKVKCEDLPGTAYVAQAGAQRTWVGVYGAIAEAEVRVSFDISLEWVR
jgi:hypothetical protein